MAYDDAPDLSELLRPRLPRGGLLPVARGAPRALPAGDAESGLTGRPGQPASTQHVQVDVKDGLPRIRVAVEDRAIAALRVAALLRQRRSPARHLSNQPIVCRGQIVQGRNMTARNNQ